MSRRPNGIIRLSAVEMAQQIKSGKLSAQEVVEAHIQRIEAVNPQLNAVVIPLFEEALAQAVAADEAQQRGEPLGPLHGVPVTIKEQHRVGGTQTTLGATHQIGKVYNSEGPLVRKLRQAGAIILGLANLHGADLRLHVLAPVDVEGRRGWYSAPLNKPRR